MTDIVWDTIHHQPSTGDTKTTWKVMFAHGEMKSGTIEVFGSGNYILDHGGALYYFSPDKVIWLRQAD